MSESLETRREAIVENAFAVSPQKESRPKVRRKPQIRNETPRVLLMHVGNCGGNIASWDMATFAPELHSHLGIGITNTESAQFARFDASNAEDGSSFGKWLDAADRFSIIPLGEQYGAGADPVFARRLVKERLDDFERLFKPYDAVILIGGLGKGTGSGILPELARLARRMNKLCMAHVVCPFSWEGKGHWKRARDARRELLSLVPTFIGYNQNIYRIMNGEDLAMSEARRMVNEMLLQPQIMLVRELIQEEGDSNHDLRDLHRRILPHGTVGFIGLFVVKAEHLDGNGRLSIPASEVVRHLTDNPLMGSRKILQKSVANMFWYHGPCWTSKLMQDVTNGVNDVIGNSHLQETLPGWIERPKDDIMFVGMLAVAPFDVPKRKSADSEDAERVDLSFLREGDLEPDESDSMAVVAAPPTAVTALPVVAPPSMVPDPIVMPNWVANQVMDVTSNGRRARVYVDKRFRDLWQAALADEATTEFDFERLIDFLGRKGCPTRPDNPKMEAASAFAGI